MRNKLLFGSTPVKWKHSILMILIMVHGVASAGEIKVTVTEDDKRIYVSVFNVSNSNFRWDPFPHAEQSGDVVFEFADEVRTYPSHIQSRMNGEPPGLVWIQPGEGVAFSRIKSVLQQRHRLPAGCYSLRVIVGNANAVAWSTGVLEAGPVVTGESAPIRVCFSQLRMKGEA